MSVKGTKIVSKSFFLNVGRKINLLSDQCVANSKFLKIISSPICRSLRLFLQLFLSLCREYLFKFSTWQIYVQLYLTFCIPKRHCIETRNRSFDVTNYVIRSVNYKFLGSMKMMDDNSFILILSIFCLINFINQYYSTVSKKLFLQNYIKT